MRSQRFVAVTIVVVCVLSSTFLYNSKFGWSYSQFAVIFGRCGLASILQSKCQHPASRSLSATVTETTTTQSPTPTVTIVTVGNGSRISLSNKISTIRSSKLSFITIVKEYLRKEKQFLSTLRKRLNRFYSKTQNSRRTILQTIRDIRVPQKFKSFLKFTIRRIQALSRQNNGYRSFTMLDRNYINVTSEVGSDLEEHKMFESPYYVNFQDDNLSNSTLSVDRSLVGYNGIRSDVAPNGTDLSGRWEIVVDNKFKEQFDRYLALLGQSTLLRYVALSVIGLSTEETIQSDNGKSLFIKGVNARGVWERTLYSSLSDDNNRSTPIVTADSETVQAEAWWDGHCHVSWLHGIQKYGGGSFESHRYLQDNGTILICQSIFHPTDSSREKAIITWKFRRSTTNES